MWDWNKERWSAMLNKSPKVTNWIGNEIIRRTENIVDDRKRESKITVRKVTNVGKSKRGTTKIKRKIKAKTAKTWTVNSKLKFLRKVSVEISENDFVAVKWWTVITIKPKVKQQFIRRICKIVKTKIISVERNTIWGKKFRKFNTIVRTLLKRTQRFTFAIRWTGKIRKAFNIITIRKTLTQIKCWKRTKSFSD
jgi:hypothetical protein